MRRSFYCAVLPYIYYAIIPEKKKEFGEESLLAAGGAGQNRLRSDTIRTVYIRNEMRDSNMRIMAVDYGDAHTGVAISDPTGMLAGWTTTIDSWKQDTVVERLKEIIQERDVEAVVLGYPKNMNDTRGERVRKSEALAARLEEETGLSVHLWDERLTTVDAHRILSENGRRGKRRKQRVDAVAATLILEGYLGYLRNQRERGVDSAF